MPSYNDVPTRSLLRGVLDHVDTLLLVDDGSDRDVARGLDGLAAELGLELLRLPSRGGKGSAVRAGARRLAGRHDAVLVVDADGQHPPAAIPAFVAAARDAELVIGDRLGDLSAMPVQRRIANRLTRRLFALVTGHDVRDTQNGMRLLRGRALDSLPDGSYEAETRHLKRALADGVRVTWVAIPAIYGRERSSFRPVVDSLRVLAALLTPTGARPAPSPASATAIQPSDA
ncbi:MAG: glycosyltransferase family 2 protein [Thermoleophilia bacterium]|nr:glycosyltransferase family 2 protein [Thermoleophilia bacterium]